VAHPPDGPRTRHVHHHRHHGRHVGLGAGWANVPVLNLMMGAPLKISVATSNSCCPLRHLCRLIYMNNGAVLPMLVAPSIIASCSGHRGREDPGQGEAQGHQVHGDALLLFAGLRRCSRAGDLEIDGRGDRGRRGAVTTHT